LLYENHELRYSKLDKNDAIQKRNDDIAQAHKYLETLINLSYPSNAILFVQENVYNGLQNKEGYKLQDPFIMDKLTTKEEMSGLLNEAIKGLHKLLKKKNFSYSIGVEEVKKFWDFYQKSRLS
jgi:hypothetical protein